VYEGDPQSICLASTSISFCQLGRHRTDNFVVDDGRAAIAGEESPPGGRWRPASRRRAIGVTLAVRYESPALVGRSAVKSIRLIRLMSGMYK